MIRDTKHNTENLRLFEQGKPLTPELGMRPHEHLYRQMEAEGHYVPFWHTAVVLISPDIIQEGGGQDPSVPVTTLNHTSKVGEEFTQYYLNQT